MQAIETMSSERYYKELEIIKRHFSQLRKAYIPLTGEVLSGALTSNDLYLIPTVDRSTRLIDGFVQLMATRNLTCIGALLRMEIDTCIRSPPRSSQGTLKLLYRDTLKARRSERALV